MDVSLIIAWLGFTLAAYSVVGNDVIQTLGTFLSSNEKKPWYVLFGFAGVVLVASLWVGYNGGDIAHGRLDKYAIPEVITWWYLLPPLVLLLITRSGIPVSTTFMILTLFSLTAIEGGNVGEILGNVIDTDTKLGGMINKSIMGYLISFSVSIVVYLVISNFIEKYFLDNKIKPTEQTVWTVLQWGATGFLWYQWLTQDLANIYVFLGLGKTKSEGLMIGGAEFALSCFIIVGLLGYIFYSKGGAVQKVVLAKTNTTDIRSATIVDLIYGIILFVFKTNSLGLFEAKLPMSTTWVF
ncbi:MAG: hypothetical protein ACPG5P_03445, partial [Saprospiraceae bacterium]